MTNAETIQSLKDQIYVRELIASSLNGALQWTQTDQNIFQANFTEPPPCNNPQSGSHFWTLSVSRLLVNGNYIFQLDVSKDSQVYLSYNSSNVSTVQSLYDTVENLALNPAVPLDDALDFFGGIATNGPDPITYDKGSGGILVGGSAA